MAEPLQPATSVDDLLGLYDEPFIDQLYRCLLGREPDPVGRLGHLAQLRLGHPKADFIVHFAVSAEGRAHGAAIEGLQALCERRPPAKAGVAAGWLAGRAVTAGLAMTTDVAAAENRLGRTLQGLASDLQSGLRQDLRAEVHGVARTLAGQLQSLEDGAANTQAAVRADILASRQATVQAVGEVLQPAQDAVTAALQSLRDGLGQLTGQTGALSQALADNARQLGALALQATSQEHNASESYRRMVQLGQTLNRLESRLDGFEQQLGRFERQVLAPDASRTAAAEAAIKGLQDAVDRLQQQRAAAPAASATEPSAVAAQASGTMARAASPKRGRRA